MNTTQDQNLPHTLAIIYTTIATLDQARDLVQKILTAHLAACANIITGGESWYFWEGKVTSNAEIFVFFKTTIDKQHQLREEIERIHPYAIPCILRGTLATTMNFHTWVVAETQDPSHATASNSDIALRSMR